MHENQITELTRSTPAKEQSFDESNQIYQNQVNEFQ